jgi:hypothetical protein
VAEEVDAEVAIDAVCVEIKGVRVYAGGENEL